MTDIEGLRAASEPAKVATLKGAVITTVTAWRHGVTLGFNDSPLAVNIEGDAEIGSGERVDHYPADDSTGLAKRLLDYLGAHVIAATVSEDESLSLRFATDLTLIVRADPAGYESYVIFLPDGSTLAG